MAELGLAQQRDVAITHCAIQARHLTLTLTLTLTLALTLTLTLTLARRAWP